MGVRRVLCGLHLFYTLPNAYAYVVRVQTLQHVISERGATHPDAAVDKTASFADESQLAWLRKLTCPPGKTLYNLQALQERMRVNGTKLELVGVKQFLDRVLCRWNLCRRSRHGPSLDNYIKEYTGEFGYEILARVPHIFAKCNKGTLGNTTAVEGMEPYYFFNLANHQSVKSQRRFQRFSWADQSAHVRDVPWNADDVHVLPSLIPDSSKFLPPPYMKFFANDVFRFSGEYARPLVVVSNKYRVEWGKSPSNSFDIDTLRDIFTALRRMDVNVIYLRSRVNTFKRETFAEGKHHDQELNDFGDLGDDEMIKQEFPHVATLQQIVETVEKHLDDPIELPRAVLVNTLVMGLSANADRFITVQGGDAAAHHYFCRESFMYINKDCGSARELRNGDLHWWHRLSSDQTWLWPGIHSDPAVAAMSNLQAGVQDESVVQPLRDNSPCVTHTFLQHEGLVAHLEAVSVTDDPRHREAQRHGLWQAPLEAAPVSHIQQLLDMRRGDTQPRYCPHCLSAFPEDSCKFCVQHDSNPDASDRPLASARTWMKDRIQFHEESDKPWALGPLYVITMDERKEHVKSLLSSMGASANIVKAFNTTFIPRLTPKEWYVADVSRVKAPDFDFNHKASLQQKLKKVACQVSQLAVLSHFLEREDRPAVAIVMEDDLALSDGIEADRVSSIISSFRENVSTLVGGTDREKKVNGDDEGWDLLYFGYCYEPVQSKEYARKDVGVQPLIHPYCRHAFAVTRTGAKVILDAALPVQTTGDRLMGRLVYTRQLRAYGPLEPIFVQDRDTFGNTLGNAAKGKPASFRTLKQYKTVGMDPDEVKIALELAHGSLRQSDISA